MSTKSSDFLTYREALFQSMEDALQENPNTVIFGQGVDDFRGTFGTTVGLAEKYGAHRVSDTPISEEGVTGICIGAALNGLRPIHIHIRADFLFLALNQIFNMAAKYKYMFGGQYDVPIFIRAIIGRSWGQGGQHSQSPQSVLSHFPGLKVIMPATASSVLQSYRYALNAYQGPVISLEHRLLYDVQFDLNGPLAAQGEHPFGSRVLREGSDVTIFATSLMVLEAMRSAEYLAIQGVSCEVIDLHDISDIDESVVLNSVEKTGRVLVADTSWLKFGVSAEICRIICEYSPQSLKRPVKQLGMAESPCPTAKSLEDLYYPNMNIMIEQVMSLLDIKIDFELPETLSSTEAYRKFKGPF